MRPYTSAAPARKRDAPPRRQREALITSSREKNSRPGKKFFSKMRAMLQRHDKITAPSHLAINAEAR
jgi:hypothetical protein